MQTTRTFRRATVLFVLGLVPEITGACVGVYTDFSIDAEESELTAWGAVADSFNSGYCFDTAYSQWSYWEHSYEASVEITSPTQNYAYGDGYMSNVSYGGGVANASAFISFDGDPGQYIIIWVLRIYCNIGGLFIDYVLPLFPTLELLDITRYHNSANPSDEAVLTTTEVDTVIHPYATELLWTDDDASATDDVSCPHIFLRKGPIDTFEPFGDGDGDIDNASEQATILGFPYLVSVVRNIFWCSEAKSPATVGCADTSGIYVERTQNPGYEGALWAHEHGHYKGLWLGGTHSGNSSSLFYPTIGWSTRQVTQTECDAIRQ